MDDQRPIAREGYNQSYMHTPAMDRLTREGTTFTRAFANFAWCAPSRNSFMSGRRPDVTRAWDFEHHFREALPNATSLPQAFKNAGWWATSVGKVYHPGLPPNADGALSWSDIDRYPVSGPNKPGSVIGYRNWNHHDAGGAQEPAPPSAPADASRSAHHHPPGAAAANYTFDDCDAGIVDWALPRLAVAAQFYHNSSRPFFLAVGLRSAHIPYHFPPSFGALYPPAETLPAAKHQLRDASQPLLSWYDQQGGGYGSTQGIGTYGDVAASGNLAEGRAMNLTEQRAVRRNYYAATSYSDAQLGRLLEAVDDLGLANSTLVVAFGDHGQALGEHNLWEKMSVFEAATRVPLVVRAPWLGGSAGRVVPGVVELVSLYRSVAELAGVPAAAIEPGVQGASFAPLLVAGGVVYGGARTRRGGGGAAAAGGGGEPYALSQMTRCAQKTRNQTLSQGYAPCAKTPGAASAYTFQGYSIRSAQWRFTLWARWDAAALCPQWGSAENQMELYDHRGDAEAADLDGFENVNVAAVGANAGVVEAMAAVVRSRFGSANCSTAAAGTAAGAAAGS
jgi:iduronate 2-sulfatase